MFKVTPVYGTLNPSLKNMAGLVEISGQVCETGAKLGQDLQIPGQHSKTLGQNFTVWGRQW